MFLPLSPSSSHHPPPLPPTTTPGWQRKSADCQVPLNENNLNNRWSYSFLVTLQFFLPHNILCHKVFRNQKLLGAENLPELKNLSGAKIPLGPKFLNFMGISILRPFMPHACKVKACKSHYWWSFCSCNYLEGLPPFKICLPNCRLVM